MDKVGGISVYLWIELIQSSCQSDQFWGNLE